MKTCKDKGVLLHDFAEVMEHIGMITIQLHKKNLPAELVDL
jgi:hypothetical protein